MRGGPSEEAPRREEETEARALALEEEMRSGEETSKALAFAMEEPFANSSFSPGAQAPALLADEVPVMITPGPPTEATSCTAEQRNSPSFHGIAGGTQSVHEAARAKSAPVVWSPEAGPYRLASFGASGSTASSSKEKSSILERLVGQPLNGCGQVLLQRSLEVLPLRSQPSGNMEKRSVFPLPTSRDVLMEALPSLSEGEFAWLMCVVLS